MTPDLPKGARIAPVRYRLLAVGMTLGSVGTATVAIVGATLATGRWLPERMRRNLADLPGSPLDLKKLSHPAVRVSLTAFSLSAAIRKRNRTTRLQRRLGIRRVDARTGGPVRVRSAVILYVIPNAVTWLTKRLTPPPPEPAIAPETLRAREAELMRIPDPEVRRKALEELHAEASQPCLPRLGWLIAPSLLLELPVLIPPLHQSLPDRLAGVLVVQDLRR